MRRAENSKQKVARFHRAVRAALRPQTGTQNQWLILFEFWGLLWGERAIIPHARVGSAGDRTRRDFSPGAMR